MELEHAMRNLAKVISEEADRNPEFKSRIREALGMSAPAKRIPAFKKGRIRLNRSPYACATEELQRRWIRFNSFKRVNRNYVSSFLC